MALLLGSETHSGALVPEASYTSTVTFRLPAGLDGERYAFVVTDSRGEVFEAGFVANNVGYDPGPVAVCACPPDLVVESVDAPASAQAGHDLAIIYRVSNNGTTTVPNSSWRDAFYLSATTTLDTTSALRLGTRIHSGGLGPGQVATSSATFRLPLGLSGDFYAFVVADSSNVVFEGGAEANNVAWDASPIDVISRPPDLVVSEASAPGTAAAGSGLLVDLDRLEQGRRRHDREQLGGRRLRLYRRGPGRRRPAGPVFP